MFDISEQDFSTFVSTHVESFDPLVLKQMPVKEKRKYMVLCMVIHLFETNRIYHEREINQILKPVAEDYVMIRRYLIDYQFMARKDDGTSYWLLKDPKDFQAFNLKSRTDITPIQTK